MRKLILALGLILSAAGAKAFDIEEERLFGSGQEISVVSILSTTDIDIFEPLVVAFQAANPGIAVQYTVASTTEVYRAVSGREQAFDLVISSAMDLQMKLANDGYAREHRSIETDALPAWARWRDQLFAFAQEPVVLILSRPAFDGLRLPQTRADLIDLLRANPERFEGRIGTYDPNRSGAGYLFATQDARQSDTFWRLSEVMGGLSPRLYDGSGAMIADVQAGRLALAYNVLGSYAAAQLAGDPNAALIELEDFTNVLLRTALIPRDAERPELGAAFLDFLLSAEGQTLIDEKAGLPRIDAATLASAGHRRPIRLDPGLLVFVDPLKRQRFLTEWTAAVMRR